MRIDEDDTELDVSGCLWYQGESFTREVTETAFDGTLVSIYTYFAGYLDGP
ncbi:hypothetical protein C8J48_1077 [Desmospora activa DSM 45169]|uniref:Uncharacterized protein n=1 Tax=Desmospora activa DSM 45169 TaxID=1121389 RepID=A0A2T4Z9C1_9BACL|nr:hypothetical protein C8J48_1077 [Desmospora activa DSM 45169]